MAQGKHFPRSPDRAVPPWWAFVLTVGAAVAVFLVLNGAVARDAAIDSKRFADDDDASRRREDATRCVAGRLDQIARVIVPIATPTPQREPEKAKRPPERYAPTTVTLDCEDAKLERRP